MKVLLDTNVFLWWVMKDPRIPAEASSIIGNMENELYLSAASCWEIIIKTQIGKLSITDNPRLFLPEQMAMNDIQELPIHVAHVLYTYNLPLEHKDPFDRIIIAQSLVEKMPVITNDKIFLKYKVATRWDT